MGKQCGPVPMIGTSGGFTFYQLFGEYLWRERSSLSANQLKYGKSFVKQRDNSREFARCSAAIKQIRRAFSDQIRIARDPLHAARLQKLLMRITKRETIHRPGERRPEEGILDLLTGFEFNADAQVTGMIPHASAEYDRASGYTTFSIPRFMAAIDLQPPAGATHYRIKFAVAELNFPTGKNLIDATETHAIPIDMHYSTPINVVLQVSPGSELPVFAGVGIIFSEMVNGIEYEDEKGKRNGFGFLTVDGGISNP